jgi:hypothetical protein
MAHDRTQTPRPVNIPTPGWYASRQTRGGPLLAWRISEQEGTWTLYRNGAVVGQPGPEPWGVSPMMEFVAFSRQIGEAEYIRMVAAAAQARPGDPLAEPDAPVDLANAPPLYRRKETL